MFKRSIAVLVMACFLMVPAMAMAADRILNDKIASVTTAIDKNGNQYVRIIVNEERKLQGVSYQVGTAVMCFGQLAAKAKTLKAGDTIKAVVASREYRGNTSYTVRAWLK
jgi:hypothetical protein